jgi:hypothetical protein
MDAAFVALVFGLASALSGIGIARRLSVDRPPFALGACLALSGLVVIGSDLAAVLGHRAWRIAIVWLPLAFLGAAGEIDNLRRSRWNPRTGLADVSVRVRILSMTIAMALAPLLVLQVPLDTDAQGFGALALAIRDGGTINTLAPWHPDVAYLYSPGALILFAFVSSMSGLPMPDVMLGVSHGAIVLFVWLAWELGAAIGGDEQTNAWPWATSVAAALSIGIWTALADSHYTAIFGLLFALAYLTALLRFFRTGRATDLAAAAVALAAVPVAHVDSAMILSFGVASFLLAGWVGMAPTRGRWLLGVLVPPLAAMMLATPWLLSLQPLLQTGIRSPFETSLTHWRQWLLYQGIVWPALAAFGAAIWIRRHRAWAAAMALWIGAIVDASTTGWIESALPGPLALTLRFTYPFSMAWHGPIIPCLVLGAGAIVWWIERTGVRSLRMPSWSAAGGAIGVALLAVAFAGPLRRASTGVLTLHGAFASANDLAAMTWIREHAPRGARVLNYPGDYDNQRDWEAHWAPVVTERECVYFRMQPFFMERPRGAASTGRSLASIYEAQRAFLQFWRDPADPTNASLLRSASISYVLVPESIGDPSSLSRAWRWMPPALLDGVRSTPDQATYLNLAHASGGAQVFEVLPEAPTSVGGLSR